MKNIILIMIRGISCALSLFAIFGMVVDMVNGGTYYFDNWNYTKMVIGAVVVGLGFSIPTLIYDNKKLPYGAKIFIHMGIGCIVMLITSLVVGWIPKERGIMICTIVMLVEVFFAFIMWYGFTVYYKNMASKMNKKIEEMSK